MVNGDVTVDDEAYDPVTWNGNLTVPTKNAIRDALVDGTPAFGTIAVNGQSDIVASGPEDTLTFLPDTGISLITNPVTKTITVKSTVRTNLVLTEDLTSVAGGGHTGDGTAAFTVPYPPIVVFQNGQAKTAGHGYSFSDPVITFDQNTVNGDDLFAIYNSSSAPPGGGGTYLGTLSALTT